MHVLVIAVACCILLQALILVNKSGKVSVLSIQSLCNLLSGGHVTGWSVTPPTNEQFFLLEVSELLLQTMQFTDTMPSIGVTPLFALARIYSLFVCKCTK